ncbi:MAG: hypothetical protein IJB90_03245 [Clostridia bacterium]|nr:hypothetical protein [Clostridia bacterium]
MKVLTNKKNLKILSIILIFSVVLISIIPNYSFADEDDDTGGKLFKPIFKLFAGVGDLVVKGLQKIFVGDGNIRIENPRKIRK